MVALTEPVNISFVIAISPVFEAKERLSVARMRPSLGEHWDTILVHSSMGSAWCMG
jgi:hypothetical protein